MPTRTYPNLGKPVIAWTPRDLFVYGADGAWYDPTDLSTLYQDTAGTVPVTAPGEPVGLMRDKSGKGRHVSQAVAAYRPQLARWPRGGRRNLLTWTEDLTRTDWSKVACVVSAVGDGSFKVTPAEATAAIAPYAIGVRQPAAARGLFSGTGAINTFSIEMRAGELGVGILLFSATANVYGGIAVNLTTGVILEATGANLAGAITLGACTPVAGDAGWYRLSFTHTQAGAMAVGGSTFSVSCAPLGLTRYLAYVPTNTTFDGFSGVYVRKPQMERAAPVSPYQRVTTANDVSEAGTPDVWHLSLDGVDDLMASTATFDVNKPWYFACCAMIEVNGGASAYDGNLFGLQQATVTRLNLTARSANARTFQIYHRSSGGTQTATPLPPNGTSDYEYGVPTLVEGWADGANLYCSINGGTPRTAAYTPGASPVLAPLQLGSGAAIARSHYFDAIALQRIPSASERAALRADWAKRYLP